MLDYALTAPLIFSGFMIFLLAGFPVAFSLAALGLFFGVITIEIGYFTLPFLQALPYRIFDIMSNELLLATPFFTSMGVILERSGPAEDLLDEPSSSSAPCRAAWLMP
jgi:TRAP-type mannitol/chloroaromatic compound transport system permease large subunit